MAGRQFDIVLHMLDHQIVDTDGRLVGKVDDVELRVAADGSATVVALLSGPGVLAERLGHTTYGRWRQRVEHLVQPGGAGRSRIEIGEVRSFGPGIRINRVAADLAAFGSERWVRDHVVSKIPGATDAAG